MLNAFHYVIIIANNEKSFAFTGAIIETITVEMLNAFHYVIIIANKTVLYILRRQSNMKKITHIKNVMIFGDSYSTFEGYIPLGYDSFYTVAGRNDNDLTVVEQTWWHSLCTEMDLNLVLNNSWSGSTICYTGYNNSYAKASSFVNRLDLLIQNGFFEENVIDTVFVYGATNDSWANSPLGQIKLHNHTEEDLLCVCPAIGYFIGKLRQVLPDANIIFIINNGIKPEIIDAIKTSSEYFQTDYVQLPKLDTGFDHPTIKGMTQIKDCIKAFLENY